MAIYFNFSICCRIGNSYKLPSMSLYFIRQLKVYMLSSYIHATYLDNEAVSSDVVNTFRTTTKCVLFLSFLINKTHKSV